ncbi:MAG: L-ribulose-5-phosphate 4-epimerase [Bacteroidetes bacterium]|nr:MAG: L-ribulose-5-phosphate 4-epimerase [Bacteroidota bacterium]
MNKYQHIKEEAYRANMELPQLGLVKFTFGNASVADRELAVFAIKPSGVLYEELGPDKMVIVDFNGHVVEGELRPSSDTKTHAVLYSEWKNIQAIVHTHSLYATAWAQANRNIPIYGTTHADYHCDEISCSPPMDDNLITGDYEQQTGWQIIQHFKDCQLNYEEVEMVLLGSHGPFSWGSSGSKAVHNSAVLEYIAHLAFLTEQINAEAPTLKDSLIKKHFQRKHGPDSYYGQP